MRGLIQYCRFVAEPRSSWRYLQKPTSMKARYGVSYLRNLCAQAGLGLSENEPDEDAMAVDCLVRFSEASVNVQVKCTGSRLASGGPASISVRSHWVDGWRRQALPVYFVVVQVPARSSQWITHEPSKTIHGSRAFWKRIQVADLGRSIRVDTSQRLTIDTFDSWHQDMLSCLTAPTEVSHGA